MKLPRARTQAAVPTTSARRTSTKKDASITLAQLRAEWRARFGS